MAVASAPPPPTAAPSQPARTQGTRSAAEFTAAIRLRARYCASSYTVNAG